MLCRPGTNQPDPEEIITAAWNKRSRADKLGSLTERKACSTILLFMVQCWMLIRCCSIWHSRLSVLPLCSWFKLKKVTLGIITIILFFSNFNISFISHKASGQTLKSVWTCRTSKVIAEQTQGRAFLFWKSEIMQICPLMIQINIGYLLILILIQFLKLPK